MLSMQPNREESDSKFSLFNLLKYKYLFIGFTGGVVSTLLFHPLDLLKLRFAVNTGQTASIQYHSVGNAVRTIFQQEGLRGFYKGVVPSVYGSGLSWGFYFMFYRSIKDFYQGDNTITKLDPKTHVLVAAEAGALTLIFVSPVWVVKTRLCLQSNAQKKNPFVYYDGILDAFRKIYKTEGVRGYYKGFVAGVVGVSTGAVQFMTYEELKILYNKSKHSPNDAKLDSSVYMLCATCSKLISAITMYPYQVVRARLQHQNSVYKGMLDCISQTWRYEGTRGFYKGLVPYLLHAIPNICLVLLFYERFSDTL